MCFIIAVLSDDVTVVKLLVKEHWNKDEEKLKVNSYFRWHLLSNSEFLCTFSKGILKHFNLICNFVIKYHYYLFK